MRFLTRKSFLFLFLLGLAWQIHFTSCDSKPPESLGIHERKFPLTFRAQFLSPGRQKTGLVRGDEIRFGPVKWLAPTYGLTAAMMWGVATRVVFETTEDRKNVLALKIEPVKKENGESAWNLWRHRHGFQFLSGRGYFWNSVEDTRPLLDPQDSVFFDEVLRHVWGYWVQKRLPYFLSAGNTALGAHWSSLEEPEENLADLKKSVRLKYTKEGLFHPVPVIFQINLWNVPVKIDFQIVKSTDTSKGVFLMIGNKYRWRYDMGEWRRRHGYEKTLLGGFDWAKGFPITEGLSEENGRRLDRLIERTVEIWVDMAVLQVLDHLNRDFAQALSELD
ncbi:MAG: hypothetical protein KCHDKBKB_02065 [Elusimicrobia bacterium]|nr:hypothetical protein [Elusimicrobiota bacterium]